MTQSALSGRNLPGHRNGNFRKSKDQFIKNGAGSWGQISFKERTVALVDEIEHPLAKAVGPIAGTNQERDVSCGA